MSRSESDFAALVVAWLRSQGWGVYEEVEHRMTRADIVAVKGPLLHVVECKLAFGFPVLQQARRWLGRANLVSVATPATSRQGKLCEDVCAWLGIGWLVDYYSDVAERVAPKLWRRTDPGLHKILRPEHQAYARAGSNGGYFSAWRATTERLKDLVAQEPGLTMREIVDKLPHHYATAKSARSVLLRDIEIGRITGLRIDKTWGTARLFPVDVGIDHDLRVLS